MANAKSAAHRIKFHPNWACRASWRPIGCERPNRSCGLVMVRTYVRDIGCFFLVGMFTTDYSTTQLLDPLRDSQLRTARPRIDAYLVIRRDQRLFCDCPPPLAMERLFHDAVLERMERDDREPSAWPEDLGGRDDCLLQTLKLVVHDDAERLKRACRLVDLTGPILQGPSRSGRCLLDHRHQVERADDP